MHKLKSTVDTKLALNVVNVLPNRGLTLCLT